MKPAKLNSPADWKIAMRKQLATHGMSRYTFVRKVSDAEICAVHTAECLLADSETMTGQRLPSFGMAIAMAKLAGFDFVMVPKKSP
jgi:hypothetical protein